MKPVGEPEAANRQVRFDERGEETERLPQAQATAPLFDSTQAALARAPLNPGYGLNEYPMREAKTADF